MKGLKFGDHYFVINAHRISWQKLTIKQVGIEIDYP